jgi:hypothetical protein
MSWVAQRKITRKEDNAYSLLNIFGFIMEMHYGEGQRAFVRLQKEIVKSTNDRFIVPGANTAIRTALCSLPDLRVSKARLESSSCDIGKPG